MKKSEVINKLQQFGDALRDRLLNESYKTGWLIAAMCVGINEDLFYVLGLSDRTSPDFFPDAQPYIDKVMSRPGCTKADCLRLTLVGGKASIDTANKLTCAARLFAEADASGKAKGAFNKRILNLYTLCTMDKDSKVYPLQASEALCELPCLFYGLSVINEGIYGGTEFIDSAFYYQQLARIPSGLYQPIRITDEHGLPMPDEDISPEQEKWLNGIFGDMELVLKRLVLLGERGS